MLPSPKTGLYPDWKEWGTALVKKLEEVKGPQPLVLPTYAIADLPKANQDGLVVFVLDDVNGAQPVYSRGGVWRRFTDGTQTST